MTATRALRAHLDGTPIGLIEQHTGGALTFTYDETYRADLDATPLSLSMPIEQATHRNRVVRAYLDGLLPDSTEARERWGREFRVSPNNPFALLTHVGRDAAGAIQILLPHETSTDAENRAEDVEWLTDDDVTRMILDLSGHGAEWDPGRDGGRWSLSGAQPKIALFRSPDSGRWGIPRDATPTTHIVKPAISGYAQHHINEVLCLRAATEAGLAAAQVDLAEFNGVRAVVATRFDRRRAAGRWVRTHQEDFCQATGTHPSLKYQSDGGPGVADIAHVLSRLPVRDRHISRERFFKGLAFNVLIGGTDAHAKNYSLMLSGRRVELAPLYDIASAACYPQHRRLQSAMKIGAHWKMQDVTSRDWSEAGRRLGIPGEQAVEWVEQLRAALPPAFARAAGALPAGVRDVADRMADRIVEHVDGRWRPDLDRDPAEGVRD